MTETFVCTDCGEEKEIIPSIVIKDGYVQTSQGAFDIEGGRYCFECAPFVHTDQ